MATDNGSPSIQVKVVLNGVPVLNFAAVAGLARREVRVDVVLGSVNQIEVTVVGQPHQSATVWVEWKPPVLEDCGEQVTFFTALPTPIAELRSIVPLGNTSPPAHTLPIHHINPYVRVSDPTNPTSDPIETDVFAPGRATLVGDSKVSGLVNRDFSEVLPGAIYCFEGLWTRDGLVGGIVLLEVSPEDNAIRIERNFLTSNCAAAVPWSFSADAVVFQR